MRVKEYSARDDQALAGHDHPAAVLFANGIDTAETGDGVTGINLIKTPAAFDQRMPLSTSRSTQPFTFGNLPTSGLEGAAAAAAATVAG